MKFKRFTKPNFLKEIGRELLGRFLGQFKTELADKKIVLPAETLNDDDYFKVMSRIAMSPDGLPDGLFEAIYFSRSNTSVVLSSTIVSRVPSIWAGMDRFCPPFLSDRL